MTAALVLGEREAAPAAAVEPLLLADAEALRVRWLERGKMRRVLDEQRLAVAMDPEAGVALGRVMGASALVFVDRLEDDPTAPHRLRVVDTRSAVVLLDVLQSDEDVAAWLDSIRGVMAEALAKADQPDVDRRYVALVGVQNEGLGGSLRATPAVLARLLRADLQAAPGVIVLERERLQAVIFEKDIAGVDIRPAASGTLVEVGLRHATAETLEATIVLSPVGGGDRRVTRESGAWADLPAIRAAVRAALFEALAVADGRPRDIDPAREAAALAERARWRRAINTVEEQAAIAEAAVALDPDGGHHPLASQPYRRMSEDTWRPMAERLRAYRRAAEIDHAYVLGYVCRDPPRYPYALSSLFGLNVIHLRADPADPEQVETLRQIRRLHREKYDALLASYLQRGHDPVPLWIERLKHAFQESDDAAAFMREIREMVATFDEAFAAGDLQRHEQTRYYGELHRQLQYGTEPRRSLARWSAADVAPLLRWLAAHDDPITRVLGLAASAHLPEARVDAARGALDVLFRELSADSPFVTAAFEERVVETVALRVSLFLVGEPMSAYLGGLLDEVEAARDASRVLRWPQVLREMLSRVAPDDQAAFEDRVLALIPEASLETATTKLKWLHRRLDARRRQRERLATGLKAERPTGRWDAYRVTAIDPPPPPEGVDEVVFAMVDAPRGDEAVLAVWLTPRQRDGRHEAVFTRFTAGDEVAEVLDRIPVTPPGPSFKGWIVDADADPSGVYLATEFGGLLVVDDRGVERIVAPDGNASITAVTCLNGKIYFADDTGLAAFDPQTRRVDRLASHRSLAGTGPLDGGGRWRITGMTARSGDDRLYFWVLGGQPQQSGLWSFAPARQRFERPLTQNLASSNWGRQPLSFDGELWLLDHFSVFIVDPDDPQKVRSLAGYDSRLHDFNHVACPRYRWLRVGEDIIVHHRVFTPDRKHAERPGAWITLGRTPEGFLAAELGPALRLWRVTPSH